MMDAEDRPVTLMARDVAYLAALVERDRLPYPRRGLVAESLAETFRRAHREGEDARVVILVSTSAADEAEAQCRRQLQQDEPTAGRECKHVRSQSEKPKEARSCSDSDNSGE